MALLKHEDIYLKGYADGHEAKAGSSSWVLFYNTQRFHQALGMSMITQTWKADANVGLAPELARRSWQPGCGHDGQRFRADHSQNAWLSTLQRPEAEQKCRTCS